MSVATRVWKVDPRRPDPAVVRSAARALARGGLVAFPTETVYGLGAHALQPDAVLRIFEAKGRPADNPLIVHAATPKDAFSLAASTPPGARRLAASLWPGPLTLVLPKNPRVPRAVTGGLDTVALRVPAHPTALALLEALGGPIAAPSANVSGRPSPTQAEHVLEDLRGKVDGVIDAGPCGFGLESTVLDMTVDPPRILREGGVTQAILQDVLGKAVTSDRSLAATDEPPRSPGQKYRHYAPKAPAYLMIGSEHETVEAVGLLQALHRAASRRAGFLVSNEVKRALANAEAADADLEAVAIGPRGRPDLAAQNFYAALRWLDGQGVDAVYIEAFPVDGVGAALRDRMERSVDGNVIALDAWLRDGTKP